MTVSSKNSVSLFLSIVGISCLQETGFSFVLTLERILYRYNEGNIIDVAMEFLLV